MKRNMRAVARCIGVFVALAIFCAAVPVSAGAAWFWDVPAGSWYAAALDDLVDRGIMNGKTSVRFEPGATLTRGEFVTMLARTVLEEYELAEYDFRGEFSDVGRSHWANRYVNWANEAGIAKGSGGKFKPGEKLTRQDMAVMVVRFSNATGMKLSYIYGPQSFTDGGSIAGYAQSSVTACQRAGVIEGYSDGSFHPRGVALRREAAVMYSRFLEKSGYDGYKIVRKRIDGVAVRAVEFDPAYYDAGVTLGHDTIMGAESVGSIVDRTGAKIAVNAAFFDFGTYETYGTLINDGRILTVYDRFSPAKSAIVMDSGHNFSVENFKTMITATIHGDNGPKTASQVGFNRYPPANDGTRILYTRDWGDTLGFAPKFAAVIGTDGYVKSVYHDQDVYIPDSGYLLVQRAKREYDGFFESFYEGARIDLDFEYEGSSTQDIELAIGCGPKIVEDGAPYGNSYTYAEEGFDGLNTMGADRRVCIGVKYDGDLVILTAYASLPKLSTIMAEMGCRSAINLDGGGSTNLYVDGQWLYGPGDRLLNTVLRFS